MKSICCLIRRYAFSRNGCSRVLLSNNNFERDCAQHMALGRLIGLPRKANMGIHDLRDQIDSLCSTTRLDAHRFKKPPQQRRPWRLAHGLQLLSNCEAKVPAICRLHAGHRTIGSTIRLNDHRMKQAGVSGKPSLKPERGKPARTWPEPAQI